jgi:hypothetical protein
MGLRLVAALTVAALGALALWPTAEAPPPRARGPAAATAPASGPGPHLLLAGDGVLWEVDVRAERVRRFEAPELTGGDPPYRIVRRGARFVLWGGSTFVAGPELDRTRPLEPLVRRSWFFLPSARPGRVWVVFLDEASPATALRFRAVREVSAGGRVTVRDVRPPRGWPERAARAGLLLAAPHGRIVVWDPVTRAVVNTLEGRRIGELGPVRRDTLASCTGRCDVLRLTDVRTGAQRRLEAPRGLAFEPAYGAFSPKDPELAVPVRTIAGRDRRLALVDLERRTTRVISGSRVAHEGYTFVDWSSSGRDVFFTGGSGPHDRVIFWHRRGREHATRVDVQTGAFYGIAAG